MPWRASWLAGNTANGTVTNGGIAGVGLIRLNVRNAPSLAMTRPSWAGAWAYGPNRPNPVIEV